MKQKKPPRKLRDFVPSEGSDRRAFAVGFLAIVGLIGIFAAAGAIDTVSTPPNRSVALPAAASAAVPGDTGWSTLSATQRNALAPLRTHWAALDATAQARWIHVAERLQGMPASAVARAQARMETWQLLPKERRERARQRFELAARLSAQERARQWQQYEASLDTRSAAGSASIVGAANAPLTSTEAVLGAATAPLEQPRPATEAIRPPSPPQSTGLPS